MRPRNQPRRWVRWAVSREDFVGAVALLLREPTGNPVPALRHARSVGKHVVQILSAKSKLAPDSKDKRFKDPA